jgi:hypothetical protein
VRQGSARAEQSLPRHVTCFAGILGVQHPDDAVAAEMRDHHIGWTLDAEDGRKSSIENASVVLRAHTSVRAVFRNEWLRSSFRRALCARGERREQDGQVETRRHVIPPDTGWSGVFGFVPVAPTLVALRR